MASKVNPIPEGYHSVTPYLCISGASDAIEFYKAAFDAEELMRIPSPDGSIGHAEIKIGGSHIMLSAENVEMNFHSPKSIGGTPVHIYLYVEDVDRIFAQAVAAGAEALMPLEDQFWGDRTGTLVDPFGHRWYVSTHREDLTQEEIGARASELFGGS
jgi:PhnB protein